jgi:hypothetical protein
MSAAAKRTIKEIVEIGHHLIEAESGVRIVQYRDLDFGPCGLAYW